MKNYTTSIYTFSILALIALFSFGCSGHNYKNYTDTNMVKPEHSKGYGHSKMLHEPEWASWPYESGNTQ